MQVTSRTATWDPPERPDWANRINEEGSYMDIRGVVPLDTASLLASAERNTGLSDYGADHWREPFGHLVTSYDTEARLNLMGRLRVRSDLLIWLEARLMIEETYRRHPEIDDDDHRDTHGHRGAGPLRDLRVDQPAVRAPGQRLGPDV